MTVASAAAAPSALNRTMPLPLRRVAMKSERPTMPFVVIIAAANTVSRARVSLPAPPPAMIVRMRPTSMTVTATARMSEPNGSPTLWATTSAWWTEASTAPARRTTAAVIEMGSSRPSPSAATSSASAAIGTIVVQRVQSLRGRSCVAVDPETSAIRAPSALRRLPPRQRDVG